MHVRTPERGLIGRPREFAKLTPASGTKPGSLASLFTYIREV
jgi:hypothetical protein